VKKKPQKNWFKQKQEVFFSFIYKKKRLENDQLSFFFFQQKDLKTKKQVVLQSCLVLLSFFLTVFATWAELGKTKNNTRFLLKTEQKKRSCFKKFLRILFLYLVSSFLNRDV